MSFRITRLKSSFYRNVRQVIVKIIFMSEVFGIIFELEPKKLENGLMILDKGICWRYF